jgi:hypothetical protein
MAFDGFKNSTAVGCGDEAFGTESGGCLTHGVVVSYEAQQDSSILV